MTISLWRLAEESKPSLNSLQDFVPKLKDHLIPHLKVALMQDPITTDISYDEPLNANTTNDNHIPHDSVHLKGGQIYLHKLVRFQYTTYDVQRDQDIINPSTPHQDIMLLATTNDDHDHPFLYGRALGIYHANVIFTGCQSSQIYQARRFEFLWVRWYKYEGPNVRWSDSRLDRLSFPLVTTEGAFGFVDPHDVLRACHIIPAFSNGKKYQDGVGISRCAHDSQDWACYYVNW